MGSLCVSQWLLKPALTWNAILLLTLKGLLSHDSNSCSVALIPASRVAHQPLSKRRVDAVCTMLITRGSFKPYLCCQVMGSPIGKVLSGGAAVVPGCGPPGVMHWCCDQWVGGLAAGWSWCNIELGAKGKLCCTQGFSGGISAVRVA
jgi:hypothetical protein